MAAKFLLIGIVVWMCVADGLTGDIPTADEWVPGMGYDFDNGPSNLEEYYGGYYEGGGVDYGDSYTYSKYKWAVGIYDTSFNYLCGGVFVNQLTVLTSAKCIFRDKLWDSSLIVAGYNNYEPATFAVKHLEFGEISEKNDIAVLHIDSKLWDIQSLQDEGFSDKVLDKKFEKGNTDCYIFAANLTQRPTNELWRMQRLYMMESQTNFFPFSRCKKNRGLKKKKVKVNKKMHICTFKKDGDLCDAAPGSVLACYNNNEFKLMGILIYSQNRCRNGPNVFTRVSNYKDWIPQRTKFSFYSDDDYYWIRNL